MSKNPSSPNPGTAPPPPVSDFWCRLKRLRPLDPSVNVLGFALVTLCLICCFVYLDYRPTVLKRFKSFSAQPERHYAWLQNDSASSAPVTETNRTVDFLAEGGGECDLFEGEWVWDDGYPLYESRNCRFMDGGFRCSENGRPDSFYTKWRWQPKDCNLPRFDAKLMLEKLRGKRLVFIGDSIGRNQWESLLCMLSSGVSDPESIYEVNGNPITKHKGYLVFKFKEFNCTIEYYRSPFLVPQTRPPKGIPRKIRTTLKLDQMDWYSGKWKDADILIFNTGHWWNYEKTIRSGCYFQEGSEVNMNMSTEHAYGRAIKTVWQWIHRELNPSKTQVFFRTYAPVHFRGGDWKNGGSCHLETFPEMGSSHMPPETWSQFKIVNDMVSSHARTSGEIELELLKITSMSSRRKDGHLSLYYLDNGPAPLHRQDCSHWCLPGVPDAWNELLYALILKREKQYSSMDL